MRSSLPSIRFQLVMATAGVSLLVSLLLLPYAHEQVARSFDTFEAGYAEQERRRLDLMLQERAAGLARTAIDYSRWDDTVEYVHGSHPEWIEDNLTDDVFGTFHVSLVAVADAGLALIDARTASGTPPVPDDVRALIARRGTCAAAARERRPLHRFEFIDGAPQVVVCSPVMSPEPPDAPAVGIMLWLMPLDAEVVAGIGQLVQFPFSLHPAGGGEQHDIVYSAESIDLSLPVRDWDGIASLAAHMSLPRPLGSQRDLTTRTLLLLLITALALPSLLMLVLLEVFVVRSMRRMSQWVRAARRRDEIDPQALPAPPGANAGFAELQMLTRDFSDLTERLRSSRAQWQEEALRDSLTGLGNRQRLLNDLAAATASDEHAVALLLIDLDGFKPVNDMLGHPAGDVLLQEVAATLGPLTPDGGSAYRLGGDEFAMLTVGQELAAAATLARVLCEALHFVPQAAGRPLRVTACVGVGTSTTHEPLSVSELLGHADLALYEAKRTGRASYRLFSPLTHASYRENLELESGLRAALAEGRLVPWFQPVTDARSGAVLAIEALARWHDPVHGWVAPDSFIAVAERSGQIAALDLAIAEKAVRVFSPLRLRWPSLQLHVNMSARSLVDAEFLQHLDEMLAASDVPLEALCVELTESDLSVGIGLLQPALARLRLRGLRLVVDDFGVGASSLARLAQVHPAAVKIDGSFVRDIHGDGGRICRAIIELARELGMTSVAEYVETDEHARLLRAMGCDALQGYGISRPLPEDALRTWLAQREGGDGDGADVDAGRRG